MERRNSMKDLATIAMGVAAMIGGGFVIFQISLIFPIPGVKYILMAPYLSMTIYIILKKVSHKHGLLAIGITFSLIMSVINIFMGIAIIATAMLSVLSTTGMNKANKAFFGAACFSGYTGFTTLVISKYFIRGVFQSITHLWIVIVTAVCFGFGVVGVLYAKKLLKYLTKQTIET